MERDLLVERTQAGLERTRAEGPTLGRPRKTNQEQRAAMIEAHQRGSSVGAPGAGISIGPECVGPGRIEPYPAFT